MHFTLSLYNGDLDAHVSPKLMPIYQTLYALNPSIYPLFSRNFGSYNKRTLQCMTCILCPPNWSIFNCDDEVIKSIAKIWINQVRADNPDALLLVSAIADVTKRVPPVD